MLKPGRNARNEGWLRLYNYRVASLKPHPAGQILEIEQAIQRGILAYPDFHRPDFYDIELEKGWAYVHVRADAQVVYLIAYFESASESAATRVAQRAEYQAGIRVSDHRIPVRLEVEACG